MFHQHVHPHNVGDRVHKHLPITIFSSMRRCADPPDDKVNLAPCDNNVECNLLHEVMLGGAVFRAPVSLTGPALHTSASYIHHSHSSHSMCI